MLHEGEMREWQCKNFETNWFAASVYLGETKRQTRRNPKSWNQLVVVITFITLLKIAKKSDCNFCVKDISLVGTWFSQCGQLLVISNNESVHQIVICKWIKASAPPTLSWTNQSSNRSQRIHWFPCFQKKQTFWHHPGLGFYCLISECKLHYGVTWATTTLWNCPFYVLFWIFNITSLNNHKQDIISHCFIMDCDHFMFTSEDRNKYSGEKSWTI